MEETHQIPEWTGDKLTNGQFLNYAKDVARIAAAYPGDPYPVAAKVAALRAVNDKLTDFINETRKSAETSEIAAADARRDILFRAVWNFLEAAGQLEGSDAYAKAARLVQSVISPYKGLHRHAITKETEELNGLKFDFEKDPAIAEAVVTLGLENALSALYAANNAVATAYTNRADSNAARDSAHYGETTDSVRKDCVNAVFDIFRMLNAIIRLSPGQDITDTVIRLIQVVDQHKKVAAQGGKHTQPDEGEDEGDGGSDDGGETPETV